MFHFFLAIAGYVLLDYYFFPQFEWGGFETIFLDITFALKFYSLLALSLILFAIFIALNLFYKPKTEELVALKQKRSIVNKIFIICFCILLALGFYVRIGFTKIGVEIIEHARELESNIHLYRNDNGILPERIFNLEEPKRYSPIIDYEKFLNGVGISYKKIDARKFQICTDLKNAVRMQDFVRWSYESDVNRGLWREWVRPKGHHCFERTIA